MIKAALLVALIACSEVIASDLGAIGPTYPIAEEDVTEWIRRKAAEMQQNGEMDKRHNELRDSAKAYVARPKGQALPRATEYRARPFDPSFTLEQDITAADGRVIAKAGDRVNPLRYRNFDRSLCLIDGDDPQQVQWLSAYCGDPLKAIPVLVRGDIQALQKSLGFRLFFDQRRELTTHFKVTALPTVVRQSGTILYVEEFGL